MRELTTNKTTASVFQTCEVYSDWHNFIHLSQFTINLVWESKQAKFHSSHFWQKNYLSKLAGPPFTGSTTSPLSNCLRSLKSAAASRILLNSMQNACTSIKSS